MVRPKNKCLHPLLFSLTSSHLHEWNLCIHNGLDNLLSYDSFLVVGRGDILYFLSFLGLSWFVPWIRIQSPQGSLFSVIYLRLPLVVGQVFEWPPVGSHHSPCFRTACSRVIWHLFSTIISFHRLDFLIGHWLMFPLLNLLTSSIIIFILLLKQFSFSKLYSRNAKGGSLGASRSFLELRFDQRSYPRMFSQDIRLWPGRGYATSHARTTFTSQHLCSLEGLKCCTLWLIPEDVSAYYRFGVWCQLWLMGCKCAFDYLFNMLFGFL